MYDFTAIVQLATLKKNSTQFGQWISQDSSLLMHLYGPQDEY